MSNVWCVHTSYCGDGIIKGEKNSQYPVYHSLQIKEYLNGGVFEAVKGNALHFTSMLECSAIMTCSILYMCVPKGVLPYLIGMSKVGWNFKKAKNAIPASV